MHNLQHQKRALPGTWQRSMGRTKRTWKGSAMSKMTTRVATDVGRDVHRPRLLRDRSGDRRSRASSPPRPTPRRRNSSRACSTSSTRAASIPATIDFLAHGTTVVINALTERKGVKVGLIATEGFRDTLEIARGNRPGFLQPALSEAEAVRAALSAPRTARAHVLQGRGTEAARPRGPASDPRRFQGGRRPGGRHLLPALLRQHRRTRRAAGRSRASSVA